jgi:hypothetical protein
MLKVIALPKLVSTELATATLQADSRICADMAPASRGVPRTDGEWTALVKVASGEVDIRSSLCARLLALGLIERKSGLPALTQHGRLTLGLPE